MAIKSSCLVPKSCVDNVQLIFFGVFRIISLSFVLPTAQSRIKDNYSRCSQVNVITGVTELNTTVA